MMAEVVNDADVAIGRSSATATKAELLMMVTKPSSAGGPVPKVRQRGIWRWLIRALSNPIADKPSSNRTGYIARELFYLALTDQ